MAKVFSSNSTLDPFDFADLVEQEPWEEEGNTLDDLDAFNSAWLDKHGEAIAGLEAQQNGKGDMYRKVDKEKFNKNHDEIFIDSKKHTCSTFIKSAGMRVCYHCGEPELDQIIDRNR